MDELDFTNKVILVTGGAQGIGKTICLAFAQKGAKVVFSDINLKTGKKTEKEFKDQGYLVSHYYVNHKNIKETKLFIQNVHNQYDHIDVLVNNAKFSQKLSLFEETLETWEKGFDVTLKSAFFASQEAIRLCQGKELAIINIASVSGAYIGEESPHYHLAKSAMIQMTKYFAIHAAKFNTRCNAVAPGFIVQDEHIQRFYQKNNISFRKLVYNYHPKEMIGTSMNVAHATLFLASSMASFINGETLFVDGGLTIQDPIGIGCRINKN